MNYQYNNYAYNPYGYNRGYQQQTPYNPYMQQQQTPQTIYHALTYVSGIEGAKAFVVDPNKKVFLLDSEKNDRLFIKYADNEGRYSLETYHIMKEEETPPQQNLVNNNLTKDYLITYVAQELNQLEAKFQADFNELAQRLENFNKQKVNDTRSITNNKQIVKQNGVKNE